MARESVTFLSSRLGATCLDSLLKRAGQTPMDALSAIALERPTQEFKTAGRGASERAVMAAPRSVRLGIQIDTTYGALARRAGRQSAECAPELRGGSTAIRPRKWRPDASTATVGTEGRLLGALAGTFGTVATQPRRSAAKVPCSRDPESNAP